MVILKDNADVYDRGTVVTQKLGTNQNSVVNVTTPGKNGWIARVMVAAMQTCPHGRVYATVAIVPFSNPVPIPLWTGYVCYQEGPPASFPCIYSIGERDQIQVTFAFGTNGSATDTFIAAIDYVRDKDYLPPAPSIFTETPFSGRGEVYINHTATITAGTDQSYTVPGSVRQLFKSIQARISTSAVAGNRVPQPILLDASSHSFRILDGTYGQKTAAASAQTYVLCPSGWTFGELIAESTAQFSISTLLGLDQLPAGYQWQMGTESFDPTPGTGDQWTNVNIQIEEWAGVSP